MKRITFLVFTSFLCFMFVSAAPATGLKFSATSNASIITLNPAAAFSPTQFTVEVWVNYQVLGDGGYIISTEGWNPTNHGFSMRLTGNKLDFAIGNGTGWPEITTKNNLVANTWYHAAATYSGTTIKLYINGVEDATATLTASMVASTEKITLGDSPAWPGRLLNGMIADLRFWNVVRTPAEITADMTNTLTGTETGLVAGWRMNEGTGTVVADVKGTNSLTKPATIAWYGPATGLNTVYNNSMDIVSAIYGRTLEITNKTSGKAQLSVFTVTGQKVIESTLNAGNAFQKQLIVAKGAYILKCTAEDGSTYTRKFVITE